MGRRAGSEIVVSGSMGIVGESIRGRMEWIEWFGRNERGSDGAMKRWCEEGEIRRGMGKRLAGRGGASDDGGGRAIERLCRNGPPRKSRSSWGRCNRGTTPQRGG